MISRIFTRSNSCLGTVALLVSGAMLLQAASTAKATDESKTAAQLLRDIRSDASQVQSAAAELNKLTASANATWVEYDRQWNVMKPAVEDMQMKLYRLQGMQAKISSAEQKELNQSKTLIEQIQARTHELRVLLDKTGVQTNDPKFKLYATSLKRESSQLEQTAKTS